MGNFITCYHVDHQTVKLIDFLGNLRLINDPITAAEIMFDEPGHLISRVVDLRKPFRFTALPADEELIGGKVYMLIPANRVRSMVSKSELETLKSAGCKRSQAKRRSSKVLPAATCDGDESEGSGEVLGQNDTISFTGYKIGSCKQWKPVLEPIYEGI